MKVCVGFVAFDRYRLIQKSLNCVSRFLPSDWKLKVFQDGLVEKSTGKRVGVGIQRNLDLYNRLDVEQYISDWNLGPAQMTYLVECWAFKECNADIVILIEDDVIISKWFFRAMRQLATIALTNDRVGAFSAFGDASQSYPTQYFNRNLFQPMHHRWAFGLTQSSWRKTHEDYVRYLSLLDRHEYRARPHAVITEFILSFRNTANVAHITSQDGVRTALMLHNGAFSFMPPVSYAVNIGKKGLHFAPGVFREHQHLIRGKYSFFPFLTTFSKQALDRQSDQLFQKCVDFKYF